MSFAICIFEDDQTSKLGPLTLSRPVFDLRCGIQTLREKIARQFPRSQVHLLCREYLKNLVHEQNPDLKVNNVEAETCLFINGRVLADSGLSEKLQTEEEKVFMRNGEVVAAYLKAGKVRAFDGTAAGNVVQSEIDAIMISYPWDLVHQNASEIDNDFEILNQAGRIRGNVSEHAVLINKEQIQIGPESKIKAGAILDAENGPIYIGENVTVMPNAVIEGPVFIGNNSIIKVGAKIYEGTSIGEVCKVGGEVEESIIHSHSNKQHDGFLGHAYLGQWVNLGADTNNSDLKNNYGSVKVHIDGGLVDSGSQFAGLFMSDHSKSGINTMFNTGTVVGAMSNVFGGGFPPKVIPSFSWGGSDGLLEHDLEKALETAKRVMARRDVEMTSAYEQVFRYIFDGTKSERSQ